MAGSCQPAAGGTALNLRKLVEHDVVNRARQHVTGCGQGGFCLSVEEAFYEQLFQDPGGEITSVCMQVWRPVRGWVKTGVYIEVQRALHAQR